MDQQGTKAKAEAEARAEAETSRPQRAGEAATTRFGMEDSDEAEVPATGGPQRDDDMGDGGSA